MEHYNIVGQNNRNLLIQSKRLAPYHEDITKRQIFDPSSVRPGEMARIKLDFKHAMDRELILNDIRFRFALDLSARPNVGEVYCVRGTDLIREFVVKINEDIVFKADKPMELTHLWLMNNHKLGGEKTEVKRSFLMNHGVIPRGSHAPFFYNSTTKGYGHSTGGALDYAAWPRSLLTRKGLERHDGLPRLIYSDRATTDTNNTVFTTSDIYRFYFDMSLNQLCGPIFHKMHARRIEYVQIEVTFEPWVSQQQTQNFLLFRNDPLKRGGATPTDDVHPYSVARFVDLEIRQYRTTLLDGIHGFTLPSNKMLSWLMHRFSRKDFSFNFDTMKSIDIQLHDWEVRTNIVRVWWMFAPLNNQSGLASNNGFAPYAAPCEPYDFLSGVEILWKNDKVLDLDTIHQVYRHYTLAENKRYGLEDPHLMFERLIEGPKGGNTLAARDDLLVRYAWNETPMGSDFSRLHYEMPIYFVDLNMNVSHGVPGTETISGIVNDTSDYVIRLKRVMNDDSEKTNANLPFIHTGTRTLYVWIEYQTLVNLAAGSNQFNRGSQVVTKQLNLIN